MSLLIKNGRVITATDDIHSDIYCQSETITRIEPNIDASSLPADTEIIDASGKYVFPGFIDPHVHLHLPSMGTTARDDDEFTLLDGDVAVAQFYAQVALNDEKHFVLVFVEMPDELTL